MRDLFVEFADSARKVGAVFKSTMSYADYVTMSACPWYIIYVNSKSSYMHIRDLFKIKCLVCENILVCSLLYYCRLLLIDFAESPQGEEIFG